MRCEEIKERFVDLLYNERGTPPASPELMAHLQSCPACRLELEELRGVQSALRTWKDETPLRSLVFPSTTHRKQWLPGSLTLLRYAAIAAMVVAGFLVLSNAEITWNDQGFAFRSHLLGEPDRPNYYTRDEVRELLKTVLDDTESRIMETNQDMMRQMWDSIEEEQLQNLNFVRNQIRGRTQ
jgi:hypothetical protein